MLASVLPVVLHGLSNPDLSVSCVSALKRICRECRHDLHLHASDIMAVSQVFKNISPVEVQWLNQTSVSVLNSLWSFRFQAVLVKEIHKVSPRHVCLIRFGNTVTVTYTNNKYDYIV